MAATLIFNPMLLNIIYFNAQCVAQNTKCSTIMTALWQLNSRLLHITTSIQFRCQTLIKRSSIFFPFSQRRVGHPSLAMSKTHVSKC